MVLVCEVVELSNHRGLKLAFKMASEDDVVRVTHRELVKLAENYGLKDHKDDAKSTPKG